jgi:hypothetical protein
MFPSTEAVAMRSVSDRLAPTAKTRMAEDRTIAIPAGSV